MEVAECDENLKSKEAILKMNIDSDDSFIQRAGHIKETNHKKLPGSHYCETTGESAPKGTCFDCFIHYNLIYFIMLYLYCFPSVMEHELITLYN